MAENQPSYKKLPGRAAGFIFGLHRLWYSDNHLISVFSAYGAERYQRFYFRDIGALVIRRTKTRLVWNLIFGVFAAIGTLPLVVQAVSGRGIPANSDIQVGMVALGVPGVIALIGFIINTLKGGSCSLWVQTAGGGLTKLGAPVRMPAARKVVNTLSPLIVKAQAEQPMSSPAAP